jgi:hypothetical protein
MLVGHVAIAALLHRYLKAQTVPVLASTAFPDVVDKGLHHALRLTPSGRLFAHTLFTLLVSTAVVRLLWGPQSARSWALGYAGHLAGDLGGQMPLLYPLVGYDPRPTPGLAETVLRWLRSPSALVLELALCGWAAAAARRHARTAHQRTTGASGLHSPR